MANGEFTTHKPKLLTIYLWLLFLYNYVLTIGVMSEIHFVHGLPLNTYLANFSIWAPAFLQLFAVSVVACFIAALMVQYQFSCRTSKEGLQAKNALGIQVSADWESLSAAKQVKAPIVPFISIKQSTSIIPLWVCAEAASVVDSKVVADNLADSKVTPAHA